MKIGTVQEIKIHEYRVGLTPAGVSALVTDGHQVFVQSGAGMGAHFSDDEYQSAGAKIALSAEEVFSSCDLIVKVKEPQKTECSQLREGQTIFTYLHLAADRAQADALMESGATAIAYETVTAVDGSLPLLSPMSEVAGRFSVQAGAFALQKSGGGRGVLLGGVAGVLPAKVLVLGGGVAGTNAAQMAMGLGAQVTVVDLSLARLRALEELYGGRLNTAYSTPALVGQLSREADLIIGAVLIPGAFAPRVLSEEDVAALQEGSVLVDISIDQGGCFATSHPTSHADPTYIHSGVVHYCVTNMPGAVPRTSTLALSNATLPAVRALARKGVRQALREDAHLRAGVNVHRGTICHVAVAEALGLDCAPFPE
jgi:alanine dehydrogenase